MIANNNTTTIQGAHFQLPAQLTGCAGEGPGYLRLVEGMTTQPAGGIKW